MTTTEFLASGSVDDYTPAKIDAIKAQFQAGLSGVDLSNIIVTITAASVRITVDIVVTSPSAGANVASQLATHFTSPTALTTFLGGSVAVESIVTTPTVTTKVIPSPPPPPSSPPSPYAPPTADDGGSDATGAIIGGSVGGVVAVVGIVAFVMYKNKAGGAGKVKI